MSAPKRPSSKEEKSALETHSIPQRQPAPLEQPMAQQNTRFLMLSSSGGGGHIAAANGKIEELTKQGVKKENITFIDLMGEHKVNGQATNKSWIPTIRIFGVEVFSGRQNTKTWDETQKQGGMKAVRELESLVKWQPLAERIQYRKVYNSMLKCLEDAHKEGKPYTEILDTQAISTPALLQAVVDYNSKYSANLKINLTVTEFLSPRAQHFMHSLVDLTDAQRQALSVEAVDFIGAPGQKTIEAFKKAHHLDGVDIKILGMEKAPVRKEFKEFDHSKRGQIIVKAAGSEADTVKSLLPESGVSQKDNDIMFTKGPNDHLITMTMGSQGTQTVIDYVDQFIKDCKSGAYQPSHGDTKTYFCVLAGKNAEGSLYQQLCDTLANLPDEDKDLLKAKNIHIIPLAFQDGKHMAALHCNSDVLITRSGGMSSIEAAYTQTKNPNRQTFIHTEAELTEKEAEICKKNPDARYEKLRPGAVAWEAGNGEYLMHKTGASFCSTQVIDWGKRQTGEAQPSLFKMAYGGQLNQNHIKTLNVALEKEGTNPNMELPDGSRILDHCDAWAGQKVEEFGGKKSQKIPEQTNAESLFEQLIEALKSTFKYAQKAQGEREEQKKPLPFTDKAPRGFSEKDEKNLGKGMKRKLSRQPSEEDLEPTPKVPRLKDMPNKTHTAGVATPEKKSGPMVGG